MALIVVAADKGSPGATTSAVALAACWPRRALVAECDPHGGDLVYRMVADHGGPLDPNRGMLSIAISARRGFEAHSLPEHIQRITGGLEVVVGLGTAEQAGAVSGHWAQLGRCFDHYATIPYGADVIADCGRVGPDSPALELMPYAALVLLIARADAEQIAHVRDRVNGLTNRLHGNQGSSASLARPPIGVVLIAPPKDARRVAGQVGELLSVTAGGGEVLGVIADDPDGAAALNGRGRARVDKSLLIRSARDVAQSVTRRYGLSRVGPPTPPVQQPVQPTQFTHPVQPPDAPPRPARPQQYPATQPPHPGPAGQTVMGA
ncbi:MAG TPA: hypothetical protein VFU74_23760 [Actinocrinis sp.]|nr:hypothetical protein [Actinocrinis sp.]